MWARLDLELGSNDLKLSKAIDPVQGTIVADHEHIILELYPENGLLPRVAVQQDPETGKITLKVWKDTMQDKVDFEMVVFEDED